MDVSGLGEANAAVAEIFAEADAAADAECLPDMCIF